jgi:phage-related minor tail protein
VGLHHAATASLELADRAGKLKDFSETTGFTVIELQALEKAGAQVGVSSESVTKGLERFSVAMDDVKQATGPVYDALVQIDPQLARQIARTKSAAEAWDLFAQAARKADLEQRNVLARQTFGRSGIELTRLQGATAEAGGVKGLIADLKEADRITAEQADRWDTLGDKINENMKAAKQNIVATFAGPTLEATQTFSNALLEISRTVREIDYAKYESFWTITAKGLASAIPGLNLLVEGVKYLGSRGGGGNTRLPDTDPGFAPGAINAFPSATAAAGADRNAETIRAANELKRYMTVLGDAATPAGQLKLKTLELAAATAKDATVREAANRALGEARFQYAQSIASTRIALGVASEEEILQTRLKQVRHDAARAGIRDAEELATATRITAKEAREAYEALQIRGSALPGLQALSFEFSNLNKQIDQFAVGATNNVVTALTDITSGTVSAADGFRNLALQVLRSLQEMIIKMLIAIPIAQALKSTLGGGSGILDFFGGGGATGSPAGLPVQAAMGRVFNQGNVVPFRQGGIIDRPIIFPMARGAGLAGEAGPEAVVPLRRNSRGELGVNTSGGGGPTKVEFNATFKIDGAVGKGEITDMIRGGMAIAIREAVATSDKRVPTNMERQRALG